MSITRLPDPPLQYDKRYMEQLINQLNAQFRALAIVGLLRGSGLNLSTLPTSPTGLRVGDVWVDTAAGDVLKIVT